MTQIVEIHWQAHRGGGAREAPDNTMAANLWTWSRGGIPEADVRTTRDGIIICLHDATVARTTTAPEPQRSLPVSELDFQEIRQWDAGIPFHERFRGEKVPSVQEVFEAMRGLPERRLYVDLKNVDMQALGRLILEYGVSEQVLFTHNRIESCLSMREVVPSIQCMLWIGGSPDRIKETYIALRDSGFEGVNQVQFHLNPNPDEKAEWPYELDFDFIAASLQETRKAGIDLEVLPFRMEDSAIKRLLDMGIRWFATDEPSRLLDCAADWSAAAISRVLRLVAPGAVEETAVARSVPEGHVVIEPSLASICHADLRYFTGNRPKEVLDRKLPMALIHEGVGRIVNGNSTGLKDGQRVVIVPNVPGYLRNRTAREDCCPACVQDADGNYCHHGSFLGSGVDGIAQSRIILPSECAVPIPDEVPDEIAVLSELCSVSRQAVSRVEAQVKHAGVAVFGDGPVGYLTAAVLHHVFGVERERLHVFGAIPDKLAQFTFGNRSLVQDYDFKREGNRFDLVFECTGGRFSESAINQGIDLLKPGGRLILMGVSEERVPINTRDVLEKGVTMIGSSRSSYSDYHPVISAMREPAFQQTLRAVLPSEHQDIRRAEDFQAAMTAAAAHRSWQKTLLEFHWN